MKKLTCASIAILAVVLAAGHWQQASSQPPRPTGPLTWAYPVASPTPLSTPEPGPKTLPGSSKTYDQSQINNANNPPDWYPEEHAPLPSAAAFGVQAQACILCHLTSGSGHPESADIAGLPIEYMVRQIADFKAGLRKDAPGYEAAQRAQRMNVIANATPDDQMRAALEYFAALKPQKWYRVEEAATVPTTWVTGGLMRLPTPDGRTEPIGNRIITLPEDPERVELRDPHSPFIAYVPVGSVARGRELVTNGGGKTVACAICHGEGMKGLGDIPRLANVHPIYLMRQLYNFKTGANTSSFGAQMRNVVDKLTEDDMLAISAYLASLEP